MFNYKIFTRSLLLFKPISLLEDSDGAVLKCGNTDSNIGIHPSKDPQWYAQRCDSVTVMTLHPNLQVEFIFDILLAGSNAS